MEADHLSNVISQTMVPTVVDLAHGVEGVAMMVDEEVATMVHEEVAMMVDGVAGMVGGSALKITPAVVEDLPH